MPEDWSAGAGGVRWDVGAGAPSPCPASPALPTGRLSLGPAGGLGGPGEGRDCRRPRVSSAARDAVRSGCGIAGAVRAARLLASCTPARSRRWRRLPRATLFFDDQVNYPADCCRSLLGFVLAAGCAGAPGRVPAAREPSRCRRSRSTLGCWLMGRGFSAPHSTLPPPPSTQTPRRKPPPGARTQRWLAWAWLWACCPQAPAWPSTTCRAVVREGWTGGRALGPAPHHLQRCHQTDQLTPDTPPAPHCRPPARPAVLPAVPAARAALPAWRCQGHGGACAGGAPCLPHCQPCRADIDPAPAQASSMH